MSRVPCPKESKDTVARGTGEAAFLYHTLWRVADASVPNQAYSITRSPCRGRTTRAMVPGISCPPGSWLSSAFYLREMVEVGGTQWV